MTTIKAINGTWLVIHDGKAVYANGSKANCEAWIEENITTEQDAIDEAEADAREDLWADIGSDSHDDDLYDRRRDMDDEARAINRNYRATRGW